MLASLEMLRYSIEQCPDKEWHQRHGDYPFSQVVFHTLFYTDFYLGRDDIPFKEQSFHRSHADIFGDYEEIRDVIPTRVYDRDFCREYLKFCVTKVSNVVDRETPAVLIDVSGISFRKMSRAELHVYNIRHIQHHAAQLGLRIQLITGDEMPWVSGDRAR